MGDCKIHGDQGMFYMDNDENVICLMCHDIKVQNETLDKVIAEIDKKRSIRFEARELSIVAGTDNITDELSKEIAVLNDLKSALLSMKKETKSGDKG